MTASPESALKKSLAEFIVPQTGFGLGQAGTTVSVTSREDGIEVGVTCGFPLARSQSKLRSSIEAFVASLDLEPAVNLTLDWQVRPHAVQPGLKAFPNIRNIVAVASGKGGVGKSTVTANVAIALAAEGARVGVLDADIYGPSQPRIFDLLGERPETVDGKTLQPLSGYGVSLISIGFLVDEGQAVAWRGPMVTSALNQMLSQTDWGELDYLIVDMPPGTGDIQLTLGQRIPVSGAVIVTTPQDIALSDARKGVELFRKVNVPIIGVVENMALHVCTKCGHQESIFGHGGGARMAQEFDLPLLGSLPLLAEVADQTDSGKPSVAVEPDGVAGSAFTDLALRIAGALAASSRGYSHLFPDVKVESKA